MDSKLFNFAEYQNNKNETNEKLDKQSLLNLLQQVSPYIAGEYAFGIAVHLDEQIAFRNFILSVDHRHLAKNFLDGLTDRQLKNLHTILVNLVDFDSEIAVQNIIDVVLSTLPPTGELVSRAEKLKSLLVDASQEDFDRFVEVAGKKLNAID